MSSSRKSVIYAALIGNGLIAIMKFGAASISGSSAMFSEGVHSLVDTGNQIFLLHGLKQAQKPADARFPFGHGKEVYFWSFVVAIMIFAIGSGISIYEGVHHLLEPVPVTNPMINYIVLGLALVFEGAAWAFAMREFSRAKGDWGYIEAVKRGKDPTIFVVLFEDSAAMLGLLVALGALIFTQVTGNLYADGAASIVIGLILGGTAIWLAFETKGLLIGESANADAVNDIRSLLQGFDKVETVNEVLTMHMGPDFILVNISVEFKNLVSADDVEKTIAQISAAIKQENSTIKRVFIEAKAAQ